MFTKDKASKMVEQIVDNSNSQKDLPCVELHPDEPQPGLTSCDWGFLEDQLRLAEFDDTDVLDYALQHDGQNDVSIEESLHSRIPPTQLLLSALIVEADINVEPEDKEMCESDSSETYHAIGDNDNPLHDIQDDMSFEDQSPNFDLRNIGIDYKTPAEEMDDEITQEINGLTEKLHQQAKKKKVLLLELKKRVLASEAEGRDLQQTALDNVLTPSQQHIHVANNSESAGDKDVDGSCPISVRSESKPKEDRKRKFPNVDGSLERDLTTENSQVSEVRKKKKLNHLEDLNLRDRNKVAKGPPTGVFESFNLDFSTLPDCYSNGLYAPMDKISQLNLSFI